MDRITWLSISFASSKDPSWDKEHPNTATLEAIVPTSINHFNKWADKPWKNRGDEYEAYKEKFSELNQRSFKTTEKSWHRTLQKLCNVKKK